MSLQPLTRASTTPWHSRLRLSALNHHPNLLAIGYNHSKLRPAFDGLGRCHSSSLGSGSVGSGQGESVVSFSTQMICATTLACFILSNFTNLKPKAQNHYALSRNMRIFDVGDWVCPINQQLAGCSSARQAVTLELRRWRSCSVKIGRPVSHFAIVLYSTLQFELFVQLFTQLLYHIPSFLAFSVRLSRA